MTTFRRWRFIVHNQGAKKTWLWQRFAPDGRLEFTSVPYESYGRAVNDAIRHGFKPKEDASSVDLAHGVMHFPPGRVPCYDDGSGPRDTEDAKREGNVSDADPRRPAGQDPNVT